MSLIARDSSTVNPIEAVSGIGVVKSAYHYQSQGATLRRFLLLLIPRSHSQAKIPFLRASKFRTLGCFGCVGCSILRPPEGVRYKVKRTGKGENGERGREDRQELGRATRGNGGTGRIACATGKQRRQAGCARCVDGVDVHDALSGTACRAPTGRKLKGDGGRPVVRETKQKSRQDARRYSGEGNVKRERAHFQISSLDGRLRATSFDLHF